MAVGRGTNEKERGKSVIVGHVYGQSLRLVEETVAADTIDYLEAKFLFRSGDWDGMEKWAHFADESGRVFDVKLTGDCIRKEDHLNLGEGTWSVYLHGNVFEDGQVVERVTTDVAVMVVKPSGAIDGEPFPEMPASEIERICARLEALEASGGTGVLMSDDGEGNVFLLAAVGELVGLADDGCGNVTLGIAGTV